jgi:hypothetical protein
VQSPVPKGSKYGFIKLKKYGVLYSSIAFSPGAGQGIGSFIGSIGCKFGITFGSIGIGAGKIGGTLASILSTGCKWSSLSDLGTMGCRITSIISSASSLLT